MEAVWARKKTWSCESYGQRRNWLSATCGRANASGGAVLPVAVMGFIRDETTVAVSTSVTVRDVAGVAGNTITQIESLRERGRGMSDDVEDLRRKALQLCYLAGTMMLACKQLRLLQTEHARLAHENKRVSHPKLYGSGASCACPTCAISLPDLSDVAIERMVNESNAQVAALEALIAWREAVRELEAATAALGKATVDSYPALWEREHAAVARERAARNALRTAADSLIAGKGEGE